MIIKIISGGQGGIEHAALNLAAKLDIAHGGWTPTADTPEINRKFNLNVLETAHTFECVEKNIRQSDGALIFFRKKSPGNLFAALRKTAKKLGKPLLMINLSKISKFESALNINKWVVDSNIRTLYISGEPVSNEDPTSQDVTDILESVIYLGQVEQSRPLSANLSKTPVKEPKSIRSAIDCLVEELPLKDRVLIANMTFGELANLNLTLGSYIRDHFGVWAGNMDLLNACREYSGQKNLTAENIPVIVIQALWEKLKETHRLRLVKGQE